MLHLHIDNNNEFRAKQFIHIGVTVSQGNCTQIRDSKTVCYHRTCMAGIQSVKYLQVLKCSIVLNSSNYFFVVDFIFKIPRKSVSVFIKYEKV